MASVPRRPLDRQFVRAVRASGQSLMTLAGLSGYASVTQLSTVLNSPRVATTPLAVCRLRTLARIVHHDGDIFQSEAGRG